MTTTETALTVAEVIDAAAADQAHKRAVRQEALAAATEAVERASGDLSDAENRAITGDLNDPAELIALAGQHRIAELRRDAITSAAMPTDHLLVELDAIGDALAGRQATWKTEVDDVLTAISDAVAALVELADEWNSEWRIAGTRVGTIRFELGGGGLDGRAVLPSHVELDPLYGRLRRYRQSVFAEVEVDPMIREAVRKSITPAHRRPDGI